jgi:uncharacterized protein YjbJ (UPF0337 family)
MDKVRIKSTTQKVKRNVEKALGNVVGSTNLETDGKIAAAAGSIRKAAGVGKDVVRDVVKNRGTWSLSRPISHRAQFSILTRPA